MPTSAVNGKAIVSADITMPAVGAWHAEIVADGSAALSGKATINIEGQAFVGTVLRSGVHGGFLEAKVVGGNGGLSKVLDAKNYAGSNGVLVSTVIGDILNECGETLSPTSDKAVLATGLAKWERISGPASHGILRVTDEIGATWRVLRDGTIWIGKATWPVANPKYELIDEDWRAGITTIAPEKLDLEPGTTFRGQNIREVVHRLGPSSLRTEACTVSPSSALDAFLGYIRRQIDYSRTYPARVSKQNADGTLQVVPDDDKVKGTGLDRVPYRLGVPGKVKVSQGQRVGLSFDGGDPARPRATDWEGDDADELALLKGTDFVALAAKVLGELTRLQSAIASAASTEAGASGLGGMTALKTALAALLPAWPGSVAAEKVKAE